MEYFSIYFRLNFPYIIFMISFAMMCIADVLIMVTVSDMRLQRKLLLNALLLEYVFVVICSTVLCRVAATDYKYEVMPLWSYVDIYNGKNNLIVEVLLNVVLFIPIGLMLSCVVKGKRWLKVMMVAFGLSLCIELSQLIFKRGLCEVDDVIHNTLGAMIGWWGYLCCVRAVRRNK